MLQDYLMNLFKKLFGILLIIVLVCFLLIGCSPLTWTTIGNGGKMRVLYDLENQTKEQIDSICLSESISNKLNNDWIYYPMQDAETNVGIERYMFIQKMDSLETLFLVTKKQNESDKYRILKRITITDK